MDDNKTKTSRRDFLKSSVLTGGALCLGVSFFGSCKADVVPEVDFASMDFKDFNAYIKVAKDGFVTIFAPNPEIGQGVKTSIPMIIAEELEVAWDKVYVQQAGLNTESFTRQVAGGSDSIRQGWVAFREAGAKAKHLLMTAAANRWDVSMDQLSVKEGVVSNQNGESLNYGELVEDAALIEAPEKVELKNPKNFSIIGTDKFNVDLNGIVQGKPLFGIDYKEEGMQYAAILRAPGFGYKLVGLDDAEAKKVSGVIDVLKLENKIAVIASNTWAAFKGKDKLKVEWKPDGNLESSDFHSKTLRDLNDGKKLETLRKDGDIVQAFQEADQLIERSYEAPFLPHNCLEPMNFFADVTDAGARMVGPIQTPEWTQSRIAELLKIDKEKVTIEMTRMGGGFGRRLYGGFALEAAEISKITRTPVLLVYTREDDMTQGTYRPASRYKIAASVKNGEITGYHLKEAAINRNMYGAIAHFFPAGSIENLQVDVAKYESNITTGAWRAPYTNFLAYAEQSFFDELAEILGKDPVDLRIELLEKAIKNAEEDEDIIYSPKRMIECIKLVAEKANWGKSSNNVFQGLSAYFSHRTHVAEIAEVEILDDGPKVSKVYVAVDCGIVVNPLGAKNQIEGGVIDGVGHAMFGEFAFEDGVPSAKNFNQYQLIRMKDAPEVEVYFVKSTVDPTGLGEPSLPPAGGAIANALYKATGKRLYKQPFSNDLYKG